MLAKLFLSKTQKKTRMLMNTKIENKTGSPVESELKPSQNDFCRTCMTTKNLRPIFCNSFDDFDEETTQKMKAVTSLEIKKNDGLSQKICNNCLKIIDSTVNFRIKCKQVESFLINMVKTNIKKEKISQSIKEYNTAEQTYVIQNVKVEFEAPEDLPPSTKLKNNVMSKDFQKDDDTSDQDWMFDDDNVKGDSVQSFEGRNITLKTEKTSKLIRATPPRRLEFTGPPFTCDKCSKQFQEKASLLDHRRASRHTGNITICEECGKTFRTNGKLLQHKRACHGLEKIHKCSECEYSAATASALSVHGRRHRGERSFTCDYCGAGFYTRTTLIQHIGVHLPPTIQCPHCPKKLRSHRLLSNHKAEWHGKRFSYQCPMCPSSFQTRKNTRQHLNGVHRVSIKDVPNVVKTPIIPYDNRNK